MAGVVDAQPRQPDLLADLDPEGVEPGRTEVLGKHPPGAGGVEPCRDPGVVDAVEAHGAEPGHQARAQVAVEGLERSPAGRDSLNAAGCVGCDDKNSEWSPNSDCALHTDIHQNSRRRDPHSGEVGCADQSGSQPGRNEHIRRSDDRDSDDGTGDRGAGAAAGTQVADVSAIPQIKES